MSDTNLPEDVLDAVRFLQEAKERPYLTREDRDNLNRAKLRIAFWACRNENVTATRETLTYILGDDAPSIMKAYDRYLEKASDAASRRPKKGKRKGPAFWDGV